MINENEARRVLRVTAYERWPRLHSIYNALQSLEHHNAPRVDQRTIEILLGLQYLVHNKLGSP